MPDPLQMGYIWSGRRTELSRAEPIAGPVVWQSSVQLSQQCIAKHELRVWFEPRWQDALFLARHFPRCLICSIPTESDTENLRRLPGWRRRRENGTV